jgi:DNA-binding LacI/PurR family transcriptional regulator
MLEPSDDLFQRITAAIMAEFDERDYNVICVFLSEHLTGPATLPRILREGGVDGFLALPVRQRSFEVIHKRLLEMRSRAVFAAWHHDSVDVAGWVTSDDPAGSLDAARRVAQLGHKRVAVLSAAGTASWRSRSAAMDSR